MIRVNPVEMSTGYRFPEFEEECIGRKIYLHGTAQSINEYDCCGILWDEFPTKEGIYPCEILGIPGKATLFLWFDKLQTWEGYKFSSLVEEDYFLHGPGRFMGLIALDEDIEGYKDAQEKFETRAKVF